MSEPSTGIESNSSEPDEVLNSARIQGSEREANHNALAPRPSAPPKPRGRSDRGMVSAEWAVGLIAAVSIAGVLIGVITSPGVRQALLAVVLRIINFISGITIPG
jgi:Protein of unknown function (DUF4244)